MHFITKSIQDSLKPILLITLSIKDHSTLSKALLISSFAVIKLFFHILFQRIKVLLWLTDSSLTMFLVAYEIMHYIKRKRDGNDSFMAAKLDMSKAFDRVEWSFIDKVMRRMALMSLGLIW